MPTRIQSSKPVDLDCGIQLRGSIDLIERHPAGQIRITDHKTGKSEGRTVRPLPVEHHCSRRFTRL